MMTSAHGLSPLDGVLGLVLLGLLGLDGEAAGALLVGVVAVVLDLGLDAGVVLDDLDELVEPLLGARVALLRVDVGLDVALDGALVGVAELLDLLVGVLGVDVELVLDVGVRGRVVAHDGAGVGHDQHAQARVEARRAHLHADLVEGKELRVAHLDGLHILGGALEVAADLKLMVTNDITEKRFRGTEAEGDEKSKECGQEPEEAARSGDGAHFV
ncbi:hypothetical protein PG987_015526 [Apiospora arundinis]